MHSEPQTYEKAKRNPKWIKAIQQELQPLKINQTWSIVEYPKDKKLIGCR